MENLAAGAGFASAARQSGTKRQKHPAATSKCGYKGWALLDPWILKEDPSAYCTGFAVGNTSDNQLVRVSLRLAEPPATSYVQLHTDARVQVEPVLYATDGDLLLLHMAIATVREYPLYSCEHNLFVYKAHPNPEMGWLQLLPSPPDADPPVRHTGIACRGKDYVVAGFRAKAVAGEEGTVWEMGELSRYSSSTDGWDIIELPIPLNPEQGLYKSVWESDDMFALDGVMFWVDYHRGMIFCDVFAESPSLQFIKFPGIQVWDDNHDYSNGRQLPQAYRTVGVSRGEITFINIDGGVFGTRKTSGFVITTWSLDMTRLNWVKDTLVDVNELWLLPEFCDSPLPRRVPEFPIVSRQDSNIVHFILRDPQPDAKTWVITLNMREKLLKYIPFVSEQKQEFEGYDLDTTNIFCDTPFICCDFGCTTGSVGMKSEITLTSDFETKKQKSPSSSLDFLELCDSSADDDVFSDAYDSDSSLETPASHSSHMLSWLFFQVLQTMPVEEINDPTKQWHCPVCRNEHENIVWYKGLNALMDHARTEATQRVEFHKMLVTVLKDKKRPKLDCPETIDQKSHDLKLKMAMDLLKLMLRENATRGVRDLKDNMA